MTLRFKDEEELRRHIQKRHVRSTKSSPIHKDNEGGVSIDTLYETSVQALRDIQGIMRDKLYDGPISCSIEITGKYRCDIDNAAKGILDSINGIGFKDDKQVKKLSICDSEYI